MVLPITGPVDKRWASPSLNAPRRDMCAYRKVWRQARPYNLPLQYQADYGWTLARNGDNTTCDNWIHTSANVANSVKIVAYDRFKSKISDRASVGVSLIEASQSVQMIADRAVQMLSFGRALKRGRFGEAAAILKMPGGRPPKGVSKRKTVANNYLEFHFGWAPLVSDIYSAVDVLQSPLKSYSVKASAYDVFDVSWKPTGLYSQGANVLSKQTIKYGTEVTVSNPNLWLANQLGLINPLTLVYEAFPFSFLLEWVTNVGQFLESGTDMMGLSQINPYTLQVIDDLADYYWSGYAWTSTIRQMRVRRDLTIDKPTFGLRKFKLWGWRRAAAAVSLLIQQQRTIR